MKTGKLVPLQNRVDPFGEIHAVATRGMFTGNRGVIHDPASRTLSKRRWTTKAWLICDCGYQGRKREVMGSNAPGGGAGWTNLFFLDEVTALSAGHRPCYLCRRAAAKTFADCMALGLGVANPTAGEIDERLHAERQASGGPVTAAPGSPGDLPDGTMVAMDGTPYAVHGGDLLAWTFAGYALAPPSPGQTRMIVLTPASSVAALRAGYSPVWHDSVGNASIRPAG
jgi:hypothetical protein